MCLTKVRKYNVFFHSFFLITHNILWYTNNKIFSTKKKCKNNSYPKRGVKNSHEFFTPLLILVNVALKLVVLIVIGLFVFALIVLAILIVFVVFLIFCFFHLKHLRLYCVTQTKKNSFLCWGLPKRGFCHLILKWNLKYVILIKM